MTATLMSIAICHPYDCVEFFPWLPILRLVQENIAWHTCKRCSPTSPPAQTAQSALQLYAVGASWQYHSERVYYPLKPRQKILGSILADHGGTSGNAPPSPPPPPPSLPSPPPSPPLSPTPAAGLCYEGGNGKLTLGNCTTCCLCNLM